MTDKMHKERQLPMDIATLDDFSSIDPASILRMSHSLDFHELERVFQDASRVAEEAENLSAARAYKVLAVICGYHFNPDGADVFTPQIKMDGKRSLIPSDYAGVQQEILTKVVGQFEHPLLRARIADSCWYGNRKLYLMAELASNSYLVASMSFFRKELSYPYESDFEVPVKIVDIIKRALTIYNSIGKMKNIPVIAKEVFAVAYKIARDNSNLIAFCRLSKLGQLYGMVDCNDVAREAEAMALANKDKQYAEAVKKVWYLASDAYSKLGNKDASKQCKVNAVEQTLRMRDGVSSALAKASWTRDAIGELRAIGGMFEKIELLKKELQQFEDDSLSETSQFSIPIDLSKERHATIDEFKKLEIEEMLFRLAFISCPPEKMDLHRKCLEKGENFFFATIFGRSYMDEKGRVIASAPYIPLREKPPQEWFDYESLKELSFHYHISVEGFIKPACIAISRYQNIDERHFEPIVKNSLFVPPGHEAIFALGFARFVQGDMISATHLLIPQLENSLRYVLNNRGSSTTKMNIDLTQEDQSLSQMYSNRKEDLEEIFGVDTIYIIHLLFNVKGGPMLRHEMAHGKSTAGQSYQSECIYACWLLFYLVCLPLCKEWKENISKEIQEMAY